MNLSLEHASANSGARKASSGSSLSTIRTSDVRLLVWMCRAKNRPTWPRERQVNANSKPWERTMYRNRHTKATDNENGWLLRHLKGRGWRCFCSPPPSACGLEGFVLLPSQWYVGPRNGRASCEGLSCGRCYSLGRLQI